MAYTTATALQTDFNSDGSTTLVVQFTGDSGEPLVQDKPTFSFSTTPDPDTVRRYAIAKLAALNATKAFYSGKVAKGVIDTTTPLPVDPADPNRASKMAYLTATSAQEATRRAFGLGHVEQATVDAADAAAKAAYAKGYELLLGRSIV